MASCWRRKIATARAGPVLRDAAERLPDMHLSNITDARLLDLARREAEKLIAIDPEFSAAENQAIAQRMTEFWKKWTGRFELSSLDFVSVRFRHALVILSPRRHRGHGEKGRF